MANLPLSAMGQYVATVQKAIQDVTAAQRTLIQPNGDITLRGNILMNGFAIRGANQITVGTLNYTTLNPPVSSGGNVSGPVSSTDNAIARYIRAWG